jgi:hypothetical protein
LGSREVLAATQLAFENTGYGSSSPTVFERIVAVVSTAASHRRLPRINLRGHRQFQLGRLDEN